MTHWQMVKSNWRFIRKETGAFFSDPTPLNPVFEERIFPDIRNQPKHRPSITWPIAGLVWVLSAAGFAVWMAMR